MKKQLFFISFSLILVYCSTLGADSLWQGNGAASLYGTERRRIAVGDTITILISESTAAVQEASTQTKKKSSIATNLLDNWDQVANLLGNEQNRKTFEFGVGGNDQYAGSGQTSRRSSVKAVVTAMVTEVLESGNLFIVGEHEVKVNDEVETIHVEGVIRPSDISAKNTVLSSQIAKAQVSVHGVGVVGSKQTPGLLTKMFNWLF